MRPVQIFAQLAGPEQDQSVCLRKLHLRISLAPMDEKDVEMVAGADGEDEKEERGRVWEKARREKILPEAKQPASRSLPGKTPAHRVDQQLCAGSTFLMCSTFGQ